MAEGSCFVFPLLRTLYLCCEESHSSHTLPISPDAPNSGVHSEEPEKITEQEAHNENLLIGNGLMSDKSVELISIEPTSLAVENDMIVDKANNRCDDRLVGSRQEDEGIKLEKSLNYDISEVIQHVEVNQVGMFSSEPNVRKEEALEMPQEETGLKNPFNLDITLDSSVCLTTDMVTEDGVPDDLGVYGHAIDLLHEGSILLVEDQIPGEVLKQRQYDNAQKYVTPTLCRAVTTDLTSASTQEELEERKNEKKNGQDDMLGYRRSGDVGQADGYDRMLEARRNANGGAEAIGIVNFPLTDLDNLGYSSKTSDNITPDDKGSAPKVNDPKVGEKIKKTITKERRAKKKCNARKRRAEKNEQLGVKRLRIEPIAKPKDLIFCNFFLQGRCQKGDSCKFSHDTVPLTKSKLCKFFVRNSCMKGENCPYDHQLFKYPCDNIMAKGECIRGDKCMFSHKNTKNLYSQALCNVSKETSIRTPSSTVPLVCGNPVEHVKESENTCTGTKWIIISLIRKFTYGWLQ